MLIRFVSPIYMFNERITLTKFLFLNLCFLNKITIINTVYTVLELFLFSFSFLTRVILASFTSSIVSVHSSINLSPISHDLSHSHSQLLGFQINPLSHIHLSFNSLHSHLYLFLFQRCLLLQTITSKLHLHLHVSSHSINLFH